ncbi:hypothetical protein BT96DRAFT_989283 [Gymnopus androsaceus JB14]|uniref:F-box domain-containing protein n=1 Tax=Gymnopus androsaceus JB14 TaxID=1447944 RepID=A0A6A4I3D2_9AGAR|nr:hypothetical protein BT96DRAFT_989283 [Gymnopus androsaceus JB14]
MSNILKYASRDSIRFFALSEWQFYSGPNKQVFGLPDVFGNNADVVRGTGAFNSLETLALVLEFQKKTMATSENLLRALCRPSLTRLELHIRPGSPSTPVISYPQLPKSCPNLQRLALDVDSRADIKSIPRILNSEAFTFSFLTEFSVSDIEFPEPFLRRHPNIRVLRFRGQNIPHINDPSFLPKLAHFEGLPSSFVSLFGHGIRPIEYLKLFAVERLKKNETGLLQYLFRTKTIRYLSLEPEFLGLATVGFSWDDVLAVITSCPGLTTFICPLDFDAGRTDHLETVYKTLLENLPNLEHLNLWIETPDVDVQQIHHDAHKQAIESAIALSRHRSLKSVQLKVMAFYELYEDLDGNPVYDSIRDEYWFSFMREAGADTVVSTSGMNMRTEDDSDEGLILESFSGGREF